jgi:hypothetical protein
MRKILSILFLCLILSGCVEKIPEAAPACQPAAAPAEEPVTMPPAVESEAAALEEAPPPAVSTVLVAEPSGEKEERCDDAIIDYSHTEDGYIMVRYTARTDKRLKVRLLGPETVYTICRWISGQLFPFPMETAAIRWRCTSTPMIPNTRWL